MAPQEKSLLRIFPTVSSRDRGWHVGLVFDRRRGFFNRRFGKGRGRGGSGRGGGGGGGSSSRSGNGGWFDCLAGFIGLTRPYSHLLFFGILGLLHCLGFLGHARFPWCLRSLHFLLYLYRPPLQCSGCHLASLTCILLCSHPCSHLINTSQV